MREFFRLTGRYRTKSLLLFIIAVLVGLNAVRYTFAHYAELNETIADKNALLEKYEIAVRELGELKVTVAQLQTQKKRIDGYLFSGGSEEEIASAMQIMLQEKVNEAGLEVVSIRPVMQSTTAEEKTKDLQEIVIKLRLAGSLSGFANFIAELYRSPKLLNIDSFALHASRQSDLKIFLELKGFYRLA